VGSHLCVRLIEAGHHVICLDNFHTASASNLAGLDGSPRFSLIRQDVEQPFDLEVDAIYNLACPASPVHYQHDPVRTIRTCVLGAINVLDLAKRLGVPVVQASTSEVYGDPHVHPQTETYWGNVNPVGVRSCYDEGKRAAETLFADYRRQYGVNGKLARIFNTYGPNMHPDDGRVVSSFIVQALRGEDLTLFGDGQQTRSFCYVDDLVDGLMRLMATPASFGGPVNLGNPVEFTIAELAELVLEITGSSARIVRHPLPQDDPKQRQPDISLARETLGWEPSVELRQGLERTVAYFERLLSLPLPTR
jgi:UDP-glucuronate decarboxylase